jgi:hypothetical protein
MGQRYGNIPAFPREFNIELKAFYCKNFFPAAEILYYYL